eukprot:PhM_4_TR3040/c1_g1_i6/m.45354
MFIINFVLVAIITAGAASASSTSASSVSQRSKKPETCLSALWSQEVMQHNTTSSSAGSFKMSAMTERFRCVTTDTMRNKLALDGKYAFATMNSTIVKQEGVTRACAEACAGAVLGVFNGTSETSAVEPNFYFATCGGAGSETCQCVNGTKVEALSQFDMQNDPPQSLCIDPTRDPPKARTICSVHRLKTECPVLLNSCEVGVNYHMCARQVNWTVDNATCCVPVAYRTRHPITPPTVIVIDDSESSTTRMMRYVLIVVLVLCFAEGVMYVLVRRRVMDRLIEFARPLLPQEDAETLGDQLVNLLATTEPATPPTTGEKRDESEDDDAVCSICLEELRLMPCVCLPCGHTLHRECIKTLVVHNVQRHRDVSCPMCRGGVVDIRSPPFSEMLAAIRSASRASGAPDNRRLARSAASPTVNVASDGSQGRDASATVVQMPDRADSSIEAAPNQSGRPLDTPNVGLPAEVGNGITEHGCNSVGDGGGDVSQEVDGDEGSEVVPASLPDQEMSTVVSVPPPPTPSRRVNPSASATSESTASNVQRVDWEHL